MNIPKLTDNLNIHQSLPDQPTMTAEELKQEWDKAPNIIKEYLNNILTVTIEKEVTEAIESVKASLSSVLNSIKPGGSIYMTTSSENPSKIWSGTTWQKIENRFLLASGTRSVGQTGGEENVTLNINQIPPHGHTYSRTWGNAASDYDRTFSQEGVANLTATELFTGNAGGGQAHNNMPPYLVVNIWKRIA